MRRRNHPVLNTVVVLFILAMGAVAATGLRAKPVASDLAVVFGNDAHGGEASERLKARLDMALALYDSHFMSRILVSGMVEPDGTDESAVMAQYLVSKGIPLDAIVLDPKGNNTMATAMDATAYMKQNGLRSVIVVSQYFHIARCYLAFHRAGIDMVFGAAPHYFEWRDIYSLAREVVALPWYFVRGVGSR